ncbi:MAG: N-acetyltransferase [Planctomycetia bacterium]|nr:N-acetyltransferase [Planctomycetia bacterium]
MEKFHIRPMEHGDRWEVAELICDSSNAWYQKYRGFRLFATGPRAADVFCDIYDELDPGMGIVAVSEMSGRLCGSCFIHPRRTHISLGIMNAHPNYFGNGVARALLAYITDFADSQKKPVRLVSSLMNLESFSLYSCAGFVPHTIYQDMTISVPEGGLNVKTEGNFHIRTATMEDLPQIVKLDRDLTGIDRAQDFQYILKNRGGFWGCSICVNPDGTMGGVMASIGHPGSNMIGPGSTCSPTIAAALIHAEMNRYPGRSPVVLIPSAHRELVDIMLSWNMKNCEIHVNQCLGEWTAPRGILIPTFMPESA